MRNELMELHDQLDAADERAEAMVIIINCLLRSLEDQGIRIGSDMKRHIGYAANRLEDYQGKSVTVGQLDLLYEQLVFVVPPPDAQPKNMGS